MIRFQLRLLVATSRWVGPALFFLFWVSLTLAPPFPPLEEAAFLFPVVALIAIWVSVVVGGLDDKPHRELVAAAVGGPVRLHLFRAVASMLVVAPIAVAVVLLVGLISGKASAGSLAASAGLVVAAALIGVGVGNVLHPPIVTEIGVAVMATPIFLAFMMLFPPVQAVLRASNDGSMWGAVAVLPAATGFAATMLIAGSVLVARRKT